MGNEVLNSHGRDTSIPKTSPEINLTMQCAIQTKKKKMGLRNFVNYTCEHFDGLKILIRVNVTTLWYESEYDSDGYPKPINPQIQTY